MFKKTICLIAMNLMAIFHVGALTVDDIEFGSGESSVVENGDVVLTFKNTESNGWFTLTRNAKAEVLVVAGGGAGGSLAATNSIGRGSAGGGGAGGISHRTTILSPGTYRVIIGRGGQKVQTIVQSWVGDNGESSQLLLDDEPLFTAKGGGGGGSVKINGDGESGGSGGGGSWFGGNFTSSGGYVDGQGWSGATSTNEFVGGGGGGAAVSLSEGNGNADGSGGKGRVLLITGSDVEYGRGGSGGHLGLLTEATDGNGYGFGGSGANSTGRGGAGGDGVVIVRISKLFDYQTVKVPDSKTFEWGEGNDLVAFDLANSSSDLKSAIKSVSGTTNVVCSVMDADGASTTNGLGRFYYSLQLNDEWKWSDGSTSPKVVYWRVVQKGTTQTATIEVDKTVEWSQGKNATIAIDIRTTPEKVENVPEILFLGSLCTGHGYSQEVLAAAMNAMLDVGNVDYYFYDTVSSKSPSATYSGSMSKGETFSKTVSMSSGNHGSIYGFYYAIAQAIDSGKKYDYVVFSFDRTLTATSVTNGQPDREAEVSEWLKPFYDSGSVVWLVDATPENDDTHSITQTPWCPSQLVCITTTSNNRSSSTWQSLYYYYNTYVSRNSSTTASFNGYRALMGLFSPDRYQTVTQTEYNSNYSFGNSASDVRTKVANLQGTSNPNQVVYDNADNVAKTISSVVKAKPFSIQMSDTVCVNLGLTIIPESTYGEWTTNETTTGWTRLKTSELAITDTGIQLKMDGIVDPATISLKIGVEDTGTFRSSLNAKYNETTGEWEKDPNDGPVTVSMTPDGEETVYAEAQASTAVAWSFPTHKITGTIVHGEGEIVLNGFIVDSVEVADGTSPEVVFRGKGGYVLDYLEVDGQIQENPDINLYSWLFLDVAADHEIKVGFKSVLTTPYPETEPVVEEYDGLEYGPTCTEPTFLEGIKWDWEPVYSLTEDGTYTSTGGLRNVVWDENGNVTSNKVYVKIKVMQPGYEDGVVIDQWIGMNYATIFPQEITIKFNDYAQVDENRKTTGFDYQIVSGILIDGDYVEENSGICTNYPSKGLMTSDSITSNGTMRVVTPEIETSNYLMTVLPGDYYYPDVELVGTAPSIVKVYDGIATGTVVSVVYPSDVKSGTAQTDWTDWRSSGGGWNRTYTRTSTLTESVLTIRYGLDQDSLALESIPTFIDVGTNQVFYQISLWTRTSTITQKGSRSSSWWGDSDYDVESTTTNVDSEVNWTPYSGSAAITILPRPVVVRADTLEKQYDGTPLVGSVSIDESTETTGFVTGEGFDLISATSDSTITLPGAVKDKIDKDSAVLKSNTKSSNYSISYIDGKLTVRPNPITASVNSVTKTYDGNRADDIVVKPVFTNGTEFTKGTIYYRTSTDSEWSTTKPEAPTDAGEYPVYWKVDGGGYGTVEGVTVVTINPRKIVLQAGSADQTYTGKELTCEEFYVVTDQGDGFVDGEGITSVTMTEDSTQTMVGETQNKIDVHDTENWTMKSGTKVQNYQFTALAGTLKVVGGVSMMIIDHASDTNGIQKLELQLQWGGRGTFANWYSATNFMARVGNSYESMMESDPIPVEVVDIMMDEMKVWIEVPFNEAETNQLIRPFIKTTVGCAWMNTNGSGASDCTETNGVSSINTHAMMKVNLPSGEYPPTTNFFAAVPWVWYNEEPTNASKIVRIPARRLVRTADFADDDALLVWDQTNWTYSVWINTDNDWIPANTVEVGTHTTNSTISRLRQDIGKFGLCADDAGLPLTNQISLARASAVWLTRYMSDPAPFWLCGQYTDMDCETTIYPPHAENEFNGTCMSNPIGNPFGEQIAVNDIVLEGGTPGKNDYIWMSTETGSPRCLLYRTSGANMYKWWYSTFVKGTIGIRQINRYDCKIRPGQGFWYDRRENTPMTIHWTNPRKTSQK